MKLSVLSAVLLLTWHGSHAGEFAAVSGTGWTDISKLESTCSIPGYFVNPVDCSRFYVCVDHSTPEHHLLLRYDFDCPGGLAFDQGNKICNYPGPTGCVTGGWGGGGGGGGWGWSKNPATSGVFESSTTIPKLPSWGSPPIGVHGEFGRKIKVTPTPGAVPANPTINIGIPVNHVPTGGWGGVSIHHHGDHHHHDDHHHHHDEHHHPHGDGHHHHHHHDHHHGDHVHHEEHHFGQHHDDHHHHHQDGHQHIHHDGHHHGHHEEHHHEHPHDAHHHHHHEDEHHHVHLPIGNHHVHHDDGHEHHHHHHPPPGIFEGVKVTNLPSGGWTGTTQIVHVTPRPDVFESVRVTGPTPPPPPPKWGQTIKVFPGESTVIHGHKGPHSHSGEWQTPQPFPSLPPQPNVFESVKPGGGWSSGGRVIVSPSPTPLPANPSYPGGEFTVKVTPTPGPAAISWHTEKFDHIPAHPSHGWNNSPTPSNPQLNIPGHPFGPHGHPVPANPSGPHGHPVPANPLGPHGHPGPASPLGPHGHGPPVPANPSINVRGQQGFPAGGAGWDSGFKITQIPSGSMWHVARGPQAEALIRAGSSHPGSASGPGSSTGNFNILNLVINEDSQEQSGEGEEGKSFISRVYETKEQQNTKPGGGTSAGGVNQIQQTVNSKGARPASPIYEIHPSPDSGVKGRIIVLYAPFTKSGKRDVPPVVEVQVADEDDKNNENGEKM